MTRKATAEEYIREQALRDSARDVCDLCDGRTTSGVYSRTLAGPNAAGNYTHAGVRPVGRADKLCPASSIWARINYEAQARVGVTAQLLLGHPFTPGPDGSNLRNFGMCGYVVKCARVFPGRTEKEYCGQLAAAHAPADEPGHWFTRGR